MFAFIRIKLSNILFNSSEAITKKILNKLTYFFIKILEYYYGMNQHLLIQILETIRAYTSFYDTVDFLI